MSFLFFILWQYYAFFRYLIVENILLKLRVSLWGIPKREEINIKDKVVIITGANTGLGKATAVELAKRGAIIIMACRNLVEGQIALDEIQEKTLSKNLILMKLDLADLNSVSEFAKIVKKRFPKIHILINNAGLYYPEECIRKSKDGYELHFSVNHLGHFLLTNLLLDNLKQGSPSRIVSVSSLNQMLSNLDFDDLMLKKSHLGAMNTMPYNNSKYSNALFIKELGNRLEGTGVKTYSLCPGHVMTDIFRSLQWHAKFLTLFSRLIMGLSPETGCEMVLHCALSKELDQESGFFYHNYEKYEKANERLLPEIATRLWDVSAKLVHFKKYNLR